MKKIVIIFSILAAVMLTTSCQKELPDDIKIEVNKGGQGGQSETPTPTPTPTPEPELKVSEPGLFSAKGGQQAITITATEAWTLSKSAESDWLIVKTTSGKAGTTQVDLEVTENTSLSERTATITVKTESGEQTAKVVQSGAGPSLQLNKNDLSFIAEKGNDTFTITSNTSWSITSDQAWCVVSTSSGSDNATVTVNVTENTSTDLRSATITIKAGDLSKTIAVTQAGTNPTLQLNKTSLTFESASGSNTFTITSNTAWTVTSNQTWCTVSTSSGSNNGTITVNVSENTSLDSRSATITVKAGEQSQNITVTQAGAKATLQLDMTSMYFESSSISNSFTITSNTNWTAESNRSWCTLSPSSGSGDGKVMIIVSENTSTDSRSATITVKAGDLSQTIAVTQAGAMATLWLNKTNMSFNSSNGSDYFTITSNTSWSVTSNQTWCRVSSSSGSDNSTITVNVTENTSTSSRSATITVKAGGLSQTISVIQAGATPTNQSTRTFTANGVSFMMVRVDGGSFTMGDNSYDRDKPTHKVTLSSYYIGETEVTQELWQAVMGSNPSYFSGSQKPVDNVSWNDCQEFIRKLNSLTGQSFRLPTEAEWEFAARGGNKNQGQYGGSGWCDRSGSPGQTNNVKMLSPNELGLYDMIGNVWEWCQDWYGNYSSSSQTNPTGPSSGSKRVLRGGSYENDSDFCTVSFRDLNTPSYRKTYVGMRLAL